MTTEPKLQRTNDVVATDMNGEMVMMHIEKGTYFAITGSGGQIWDALEQPATLSEVIAHVERESDVSEVEDLPGIVGEFVDKLVEQGLVVSAD